MTGLLEENEPYFWAPKVRIPKLVFLVFLARRVLWVITAISDQCPKPVGFRQKKVVDDRPRGQVAMLD